MASNRSYRPLPLNLEPLEERILLSADILPLAQHGLDLPVAEPVWHAPSHGLQTVADPLAGAHQPAASAPAPTADTSAHFGAALVEGIDDLRSELASLGQHFVADANALPVLPHTLNDLFDFTAALGQHALDLLPTITPQMELEALADALTLAGFTVLGVDGGIDGKYAAASNGNWIEVAITRSLPQSLQVSNQLSAEHSFNNQTHDLLKGLADNDASHNIAADWSDQLVADLTLSASFGIDADGNFFLLADNLQLSSHITGSATIDGRAAISEQESVDVSGQTVVDVVAQLQLTQTGPLSLTGLTDAVASARLMVALSGNAELDIAFTMGGTDMVLTSHYSIDSGNLPDLTHATLNGTMALPGVRYADDSSAKLVVTGEYIAAGNHWRLSAAPESGQTLFYHSVELKDFAATFTMDGRQFDGATSGQLQFDAIQTSNGPLLLDFAAQLREDGFSLDASLQAGDLAIATIPESETGTATADPTTIADINDTVLSLTIESIYASGTNHAVLGIQASAASLLPGDHAITCAASTSADSVPAIDGHMDLVTGAFSIAIGKLDIDIPGALQLHSTTDSSQPAVLLSFDPRGPADQVLFRLQEFDVVLPGFHINGQPLSFSGSEWVMTAESIRLADLSFPAQGQDYGTIEIHNRAHGNDRQVLFSLQNPQLDIRNIHITPAGLADTATITFTGQHIALLPDATRVHAEISLPAAAGPAFTAIMQLGNHGVSDFSLTVAQMNLTVDDLLQIDLQQAAFTPYSDAALLTVDSTHVVVDPSGLNIDGTLTGLHINPTGNVNLHSVAIDVTTLNNRIGLAGILPLVVDGFAVENTATGFELAITARFNIDKMMRELPFTPIIQFDDPGADPKVHNADTQFHFRMAMRAGHLQPLDIPAITLGVADFKVGPWFSITGDITLGAYVNGQWQHQLGGDLRLHKIAAESPSDQLQDSAATLPQGIDDLTIHVHTDSVLDPLHGILKLHANALVSFKFHDYLHFDNLDLGLTLDLSYSTTQPQFHVNALGLSGAHFDHAGFQLKNYVSVAATEGSINFSPGHDDDFAAFKNLNLAIPELGVEGSLSQLKLTATGHLVFTDNAAVAMHWDPASTDLFAKLPLPDWFPTPGEADLLLTWPDPNAHRDAFELVLSCELNNLTIPGTELGLSGRIGGLALRYDGTQLHLESLQEIALNVGGTAFGVAIEGGFDLGLYQFDHDGNWIDPQDPDSIGTSVAERVLFATADLDFTIEGYGLNLFLGISHYNLFTFLYAGAPLDIGAQSGISIHALYGQIEAGGADFSAIGSAKDLGKVTLAGNQSPADKQAAFHAELFKSVKAGTSLDLSHLATHISDTTVEGGMVINDIYTGDVIELTLDLKFSGAGQLLATGMINGTRYGDLDLRLFVDLSKINPNGAHPEGSLLVYTGFNSSLLQQPPVIFYGDLIARGPSAAGQASLALDGGVVFSADGMVNLELAGSATFAAVSANQYELTVDGNVIVTGLGKAIGINGDLQIHVDPDGKQNIFGAMAIEPKHIDALEQIGIDADAIALWRLNFTGTQQQVRLKVGDRPEQSFILPAHAFSTHIEGLFAIRHAGATWLFFDGSADLYATGDTVDMVVAAELLLGGDAANPLLRFEATGYLHLEPLQGIASTLDLQLKQGGQLVHLLGDNLAAAGQFSLNINTTGKYIRYEIPTQYPELTEPKIIDLPDFAPEILGLPDSEQPAAWMFLAVTEGKLQLGADLLLRGDLAVLIGTDKLEARLRDGKVDWNSSDQTLLTIAATGALHINAHGSAGNLDVDLTKGQFADGAIAMRGNANWQINTTGNEVHLPDGVVIAPDLDGQPFSKLTVDGDLSLNRPAASIITLPGLHQLTWQSNPDGPGYHIALSSVSHLHVEAGGTAFITADIAGGGIITDSGLAAWFDLQASDANRNVSGHAFADPDLAYEFPLAGLGINTSAHDIAVQRSGDSLRFVELSESATAPVDALAVLPSLVGAQVHLHGGLQVAPAFSLQGAFVLTFDDNHWSMDLAGAIRIAPPEILHFDPVDLPLQHRFTLDLPGIVLVKEISDDLAAHASIRAMLGLSATASFDLSVEINTTKEARQQPALAAGPFARINLNKVQFTHAGFAFDGNLHFASTALSSLTGSASFAVSMHVNDVLIFSGAAEGALHLGFDGFAGWLQGDRPELFGFAFQNESQLDQPFLNIEFNTSSQAFEFQIGDSTRTIAGTPHAFADMHGIFAMPNLDALLLTGDLRLSKDGQLDVNARLDAYLLSAHLDPHPLIHGEVTGRLFHNSEVTQGLLDLDYSQGTGGLDVPESWGISFGHTDLSAKVHFNINHAAPAPQTRPSPADGANPDDGPPADSLQIEILTRTIIGFNQINGSAFFTWTRGEEFLLGLDGSSYIGFGATDAEGRPHTVLMGADVGGFLRVVDGGFAAGLEADISLGSAAVLKFFENELGMRIGLDASLKAYLFINTTGKDQTLATLPPDLQQLPAGRQFEILVNGLTEFASVRLEGMFGFTLFEDGILLRVSAEHELALYDSDDPHGTHLSFGGSTIAGLLQIHHSDAQKGVIGFLAGDAHAPQINVGGFQLLEDQEAIFFRINTTGQAIDLSQSGYLPDMATASHGIRELLAMPAGKYAQFILERSLTMPPLFGLQFHGVLLGEYVETDATGKAIFAHIQGGLTYQLLDVLGVELARTELSGDIFGLINKDHHFAFAAEIDAQHNFAHSNFFGLEIGLPKFNPIFQAKSIDAAIDINPFIPTHFKHASGDYLRFEQGQYGRLNIDLSLTEKVLGLGFKVEGQTIFEFMNDPGEDNQNPVTWVEAQSILTATTSLTSVVGDISEVTTVGIYIGSGGVAIVTDFSRSETKHAEIFNNGIEFEKLHVALNTTGRALSFKGTQVAAAPASVSAEVHIGSHLLAEFIGRLDFAVGDAALVSLNGDFYLFGKHILSTQHPPVPSGQLHLHWAAQPQFTLPNDFVQLSGDISLHIDGEHLILSATDLDVHLHGTHMSGSVKFDMDTQSGWNTEGSVHLHGRQAGDISSTIKALVEALTAAKIDTVYLTTWFVDVGIDFHLNLSSHAAHDSINWNAALSAGFSYYEKHWHHLHLRHDYYNYQQSFHASGSIDANRSALSAHVDVSLFGAKIIDFTVTADLGHFAWIKASDIGGSSIFLDANLNGVRDPDEPFAIADANGRFSFADTRFSGNLGALTPFDRDGDGVISVNEGVFVIEGGSSLHNGVDNPLRLVFSAAPYGDLFQDIYSPLSALHHDLTSRHGMDTDTAWDVIRTSLRLDGTLQLKHVDPNAAQPAISMDQQNAVHAAYARISDFLIQSEAALQALQPDGDSDLHKSSLLHALSTELLRIYAQSPQTGPAFLADPAHARVLLANAAHAVGIAAPQNSVLDAAAHSIALHASLIDQLALTKGTFLPTVLAELKRIAIEENTTRLQAVATGELSAQDYMAADSAASLWQRMAQAAPELNAHPAIIAAIPDQVLAAGQSTMVLLPLSPWDAAADTIDWQIASSNTDVLPLSGLQLQQCADGTWALLISPAVGMYGTSQVALTTRAPDGTPGNTAHFTVSIPTTARISAANTMLEDGLGYAVFTIELDQPSQAAVFGSLAFSGNSLDHGVAVPADPRFVIAPGQLTTSVRVPLLKTPLDSDASLVAQFLSLENATVPESGHGAAQSATIARLPNPGSFSQRHAQNTAIANGSSATNPHSMVLRDLLSQPGTDSSQLQPDRFHYLLNS